MTDTTRKDFEAIVKPMGFDLERWVCAAPEPWSEYKNQDTGYFWAGYQAATLKKRERCALVCEGFADHGNLIKDARYESACDDCMVAIRLPLPPTGTEGTTK